MQYPGTGNLLCAISQFDGLNQSTTHQKLVLDNLNVALIRNVVGHSVVSWSIALAEKQFVSLTSRQITGMRREYMPKVRYEDAKSSPIYTACGVSPLSTLIGRITIPIPSAMLPKLGISSPRTWYNLGTRQVGVKRPGARQSHQRATGVCQSRSTTGRKSVFSSPTHSYYRRRCILGKLCQQLTSHWQ